MTEQQVDACILRTLKHEGGFQKKRSDPGNWTGGQVGKGELRGTKYGISAKSYPDVDIEALTEEQAIVIYTLDYAGPLRLKLMDSVRVGWKCLDIGVNRGVTNGARTLQRALGVAADGQIGPETIHAVNASNPAIILPRMVDDLVGQYERIVARDPSMREWFPIWMKRAQDTGEGLEFDRNETPLTVG